jgi:hypothetical protein
MNINAFTTTITRYDNVELANQILPIIDEYLSHATSMMDIDNHITTYINPMLGDKLNRDPRLNDARSYCIEMALHTLDKRGVDIKQLNLNPHFFVNEIKKGGYFHRHAHPNAVFSGVFYVDAHPDTSDILFYDPRPHRTVRILPTKSGNDDECISISPETGMLLLWDSWLEHEVIQNKSDRPRKTLVFNI